MGATSRSWAIEANISQQYNILINIGYVNVNTCTWGWGHLQVLGQGGGGAGGPHTHVVHEDGPVEGEPKLPAVRLQRQKCARASSWPAGRCFEAYQLLRYMRATMVRPLALPVQLWQKARQEAPSAVCSVIGSCTAVRVRARLCEGCRAVPVEWVGRAS